MFPSVLGAQNSLQLASTDSTGVLRTSCSNPLGTRQDPELAISVSGPSVAEELVPAGFRLCRSTVIVSEQLAPNIFDRQVRIRTSRCLNAKLKVLAAVGLSGVTQVRSARLRTTPLCPRLVGRAIGTAMDRKTATFAGVVEADLNGGRPRSRAPVTGLHRCVALRERLQADGISASSRAAGLLTKTVAASPESYGDPGTCSRYRTYQVAPLRIRIAAWESAPDTTWRSSWRSGRTPFHSRCP